jgi:hypothetical protein
MRIGEALQLTFDDIDLSSVPVKINLRGEYTKTGDKRIAFISGEAREHIEEWLKYRDEYLVSSSKRSWKYEKSVEDRRLFPFSESTAHYIWTNALDKSGLNQKDASTKRHKIHPHVLRKFFRTRMGSVIAVDVTEALMGHKGYLTEVYRKHTEEDLAKFYKQGEASVMVFGRQEEISILRKEVEERNTQLQMLVNGLTTDNMKLKQDMEDLQKRVNQWDNSIEKIFGLTIEELTELESVEEQPILEPKKEEKEKISENSSKIEQEKTEQKKVEPSPKPKREKTFRELIYGTEETKD